MVYWFLSSFVSASLQTLIEKLADLGIRGYDSISGANDKLEKLERTLQTVHSLIHDSESNQRNNTAWRAIVRDLEQLSYEADDLIDEVSIQISNLDGGSSYYKEKVFNLLLSLYKSTSAPNMTYIQLKFDRLLREMDSLCLRELVQQKQLSITESDQLMHSSLSDKSSPVFGMDHDINEAFKLLIPVEDFHKGSDVSVVAIVGMVGVGKTTLAQIVYNDDDNKAKDSFELKMWVSVTGDFDLVRVTRDIVEAAGEVVELRNIDRLQIELKSLIEGKKFLLVLDDLWNEKPNEWDLLLKPLRYGAQGSQIIVTTRSRVVSSMVSTSGTVNLKCLSDQDCWSLLEHEVLGDIGDKLVPKMEEIAKKCKGLPLAAKSIGRLLHSRFDEDQWNAILGSNIWDLDEVKNVIFPALRPSYHHLPSHLNHCFAFLSMFPPGYELEKEKIVQMWMGEGYIRHDGRRKIQEIGCNYFDQLLQVSFLQQEGDKYKMHDAVLELARSISGGTFFRMEERDDLQTSRLNRHTRHSSLICDNIEMKASVTLYKCKGLRTFLLPRKYGNSIKEAPSALFKTFGRLRVLDLSFTQIEDLDDSIGNLKHLRFLDLSKTLLKWLPDTTQELSSLQTLRLKNCSKLVGLLNNIEKLTNLQHLELERNDRLHFMPSGIGRLTGLQTLTDFIVSVENGRINELKYLNNIKGSLCIKQVEKVNNSKEAEEAQLVNKKHLKRLELQWISLTTASEGEDILNNLKPHESLEELVLRKYAGTSFPGWVSSTSLSKLTSICLRDCQNCVLLPSFGEFPKLKSLVIIGMPKLLNLDAAFCTSGRGTVFPLLEILEFRQMPMLTSWSELVNINMECLRELTIAECPQLTELPSFCQGGSLLKLEFATCPLICSMPNGGLSGSVECLIIIDCPKLKEQCEEGSEGWILVKDIPNRVII
ncbi:hypothetical protein ACHQM5_010919 [Ranunculus cassubicifolius]